MAPIRTRPQRSNVVTDSGKGSSTRPTRDIPPVASSSKLQLEHSRPPLSLSSQTSEHSRRSTSKPYDRPRNPRPDPLTLTDTECIRTLGEGGYGQVLLVKVRRDYSEHPRERSGAQFAMKVLDKKEIREYERNYNQPNKSNMKGERNAERQFLTDLPWNPFFTGLVDCFHDKRNLYYMLELAPCISFSSHLRKHGPLSSADARFYFSNIVLALEFLHSHDIVHRDVKPGNILVGADGYLSIGDFGCAAHVTNPHNWHQVGTMQYVAPEVNKQRRTYQDAYHFVDWWAAAITLYEMVSKRLPFRGKDYEAIYEQATEGTIKWPSRLNIDSDLKDLVERMLIAEPAERYGCFVMKGENGTLGKNDEVRSHPFMRKVRWKMISERREPAPYVPMPYPDLSEGWYAKGIPTQLRIPDIPRAHVPPERAADNRFDRRRLVRKK